MALAGHPCKTIKTSRSFYHGGTFTTGQRSLPLVQIPAQSEPLRKPWLLQRRLYKLMHRCLMPTAVSHWEGETSAWEARLPQERAGFAQPAWLQWAAQSSQVIPESGSMMPNEPLKTLPCTPCAHGDTTFHTGPERGGAASGRSAWMLCSSKTSQNQKVSLVPEAGTFPVWQLSLSPCRRRAMCKNIVILRITIFLTDLLTFCWRLHCFNDYMVGFGFFLFHYFPLEKKMSRSF